MDERAKTKRELNDMIVPLEILGDKQRLKDYREELKRLENIHEKVHPGRSRIAYHMVKEFKGGKTRRRRRRSRKN